METVVISSFFNKETGKSCHDRSGNPEASSAQKQCPNEHEQISEKFLHLVDELNIRLEQIKLPPKVQCVYNPTIYARHTFELYVQKYCNTKKPIMYFGMNPGPWGMSQTGVPFGEISAVRDWMGIEGPVKKPDNEISARSVTGFRCPRSEVSGKRFWSLFQNICGSPENFFKTSFVYNYLPQQWMKGNGCNLTPGDFRIAEMKELFSICDSVFVKVLDLYQVETIVAVGKFCETRAQKAIQKYCSSNPVKVVYLPHPSPRTVNNNDWDTKAIEHLSKLDLMKFYQKVAKMEFMKRALELAEEALTAQEVPVGCVFTIDGNIIAEGRNTVNITRNPTRHAEMNCIDVVVEHCRNNSIDYKTYFKAVSVYVTVEPCVMCAAALHNLHIREVIYGCANDRFGGKTVLDVSHFYEYNYTLAGFLMADEAMALLKQFYKGTNPNAPESKVKKKKDDSNHVVCI